MSAACARAKALTHVDHGAYALPHGEIVLAGDDMQVGDDVRAVDTPGFVAGDVVSE